MLLELRTPVRIETELSRAEVIARLTRSVEPPSFLFPLFGTSELVGVASSDRCWFENGSFYRRNKNRRLTLRYRDGTHGTILEGAFGLKTVQLISLIVGFSVAVLMCFLFTIDLVQGFSTPGPSLPLWKLAPFGMLVAGFVIARVNLSALQRSEAELVEMLQEILKGPPGRRGGVEPTEVVIRPRHSTF